LRTTGSAVHADDVEELLFGGVGDLEMCPLRTAGPAAICAGRVLLQTLSTWHRVTAVRRSSFVLGELVLAEGGTPGLLESTRADVGKFDGPVISGAGDAGGSIRRHCRLRPVAAWYIWAMLLTLACRRDGDVGPVLGDSDGPVLPLAPKGCNAACTVAHVEFQGAEAGTWRSAVRPLLVTSMWTVVDGDLAQLPMSPLVPGLRRCWTKARRQCAVVGRACGPEARPLPGLGLVAARSAQDAGVEATGGGDEPIRLEASLSVCC
jgi:hypothetical protein